MKRKKGVTRQLIESLAKGESDLHTLASKQGMSLIDMARWVERPRHSELLRLLENLQNRRMSLLLAAARADAAESLRNMAIADAPRETARKACVDLLKLQRDRDPLGGPSADGIGESDPTQDAYSTLNRVLAGLSSDNRAHSHTNHVSDETDSSQGTESSATGETARDKATDEIKGTQDSAHADTAHDYKNANESAPTDDAARTA